MYDIVPSPLFLRQVAELSLSTAARLERKIRLARGNPAHFKHITHDHTLFAIKFSEQRKEKRLIYLVRGGTIHIVGILDRENEYQDLADLLSRAGF
jgi:mRNA-degrading endonuclease RelE of RelBE toxin-antitoxin system